MRRLNQRQRIAAVMLSVVATCFIAFDLAGGGLRGAHGGVQGALGALYRGTDSVLAPVRHWVQGVPSAGSNKSKIEKMERENNRLRALIAAQAGDRATQERLQRLQLMADAGAKIVPAKVISLGAGHGFDWTVTLDVGTQSGVHVGMTVTDGNGLVGRVLNASKTSSIVLLAADPGSGVGVRNERTGQLGIARGDGVKGFSFSPLDPKAEIKVGDEMRTGPAGSTTFTPGVSVGIVTSVRVGTDGTTTAVITPTTSATGLDLVGVVLSGKVVQSRAPLLTTGTQTTPGATGSPSPTPTPTPTLQAAR